MSQVRVRFAPSPTGFLHVGNARTALFNWLFARQNSGVFVLRVEDTDVERSRAEYGTKLLEDLRWLGLDWDEGPEKGGDFGPYFQSQRLEIYAEYANRLIAEGKAYYCFCSKEALDRENRKALAENRTPIYGGTCRAHCPKEAEKKRREGAAASVRLKTPGSGELVYMDIVRGKLSFDLSLTGDPILVRPSGLPAYNYAVVLDDHLMGISHVIRGEDHISNTPRQILTSRALGFQLPRYAHLSMVMGSDNARLSKRHGATSVEQFQRNGILPEALVNYLALLGWAPRDGREVLSAADLIRLFNLKKVSRSAAVFDYDKLHWLNRQHIRAMSARGRASLAKSFLSGEGLLPEKESPRLMAWLEEAAGLLMDGLDRFADLPDKFREVFAFSPSEMDQEATALLKDPCAEKVLTVLDERLKMNPALDYTRLGVLLKEIKQVTGCKGPQLFRPLRIAFTARASGLELDKIIPLIEAASKLCLPAPVKSCAERVDEMLRWVRSG
jgi:nondiscriminating glutamyl-tRNA synthetase